MKKLFLFLLPCFGIFMLQAQTAGNQKRVTSNAIGHTYYDMQQYASLSNRIVTHPDGTISCVWMIQNEDSDSRGTGYNYFDGTSFVNDVYDLDRLEDEKTGFGTIGSLNGTGEIVVSHNATSGNTEASLVVMTRSEKGAGEWNTELLSGPEAKNSKGNASTALLYPALTTVGDTIHLIALTETDTGYFYQGIQGCLLYYRGVYNRGANKVEWDSPVLVDGVNSESFRMLTADNYSITAKNNTVAILVSPMWADVFYSISDDGGKTWEKHIIAESPIKGFHEKETLVTDTVSCADKSGAIAIDDAGNVHVAFGLMRFLNPSITDNEVNFFSATDALFYWNSTMPQVKYNTNYPEKTLYPDSLELQGFTIFRSLDIDGNDTVNYNIPHQYAGRSPNYNIGLTSQPQLICENGVVYLIYSSILELPFWDFDQELYYRGVFAIKSTDNGTTWDKNKTSWLSYGEGLFTVEWDSYSQEVFYQNYFKYPAENVFPFVSKNIVDGKINLFWQNDAYAGSGIVEDGEGDYTSINFLQFDIEDIGIINNVGEIHLGLWNPLDDTNSIIANNSALFEMSIFPNPATYTATIEFTSLEQIAGTLNVTNISGQVIDSAPINITNGMNQFNIDVANYNKGFYLINIKTNKGTITRKLIVQ